MLTNRGTLTVAPVSSVAGFVPPPDAVSPRIPGSVCVTSSSTDAELLHDEPALRELTRRYRLNGVAQNFRLPERRVTFAPGRK